MNLVLVLRSEAVCAIILLLLLGYNFIYGSKSEKIFTRVCFFSLCHVVFDGITVYTVNNRDKVGEPLNYTAHLIMYLSAICFACEIFCYILQNILPSGANKKVYAAAWIPVIIYMAAMPFLKLDYYQGKGTLYSMGSAAVVGFGLTAAYTLVGTALLIKNIRRVEKNVKIGVLPCNIFIIICIVLQIVIPELLFTGALTTVITLGLFFAIENPAARYMKRAYIDLDTGIKNRNCYDEDMKHANERFFDGGKCTAQICCAVCDLNGLKKINDNYGHIAGDELIRAAAEVLSKNLKSAHNVYRIGGDEFVAVYIGRRRDLIKKEVEDVKSGCGKYTGLQCPLSIAIGTADIKDGDFRSMSEIISLADKRMYEDKIEMKKRMGL